MLDKRPLEGARVAIAEDRLDDVIALRDDPAYRGEVVLCHIDPENRTASFRVNLAAWAPRGAVMMSMLRPGFEARYGLA